MTKFIDFVPRRSTGSVTISHPAPAKSARPAKNPAPVNPAPKAAKPALVKPTPAKPAPKPARTISVNSESRPRPVAPRGLRIDFARPASKLSAPKAPAQKASASASKPLVQKSPLRAQTSTPVKITAISKKTTKISKIPLRAPIPKPVSKIVPKPAAKPISKPVPRPVKKPVEPDDLEPLMDDDDLALALAGFADDDATPVLTDNLSKEASDFEEELDALDDLADDLENQFADEIEEEIADFVEEPKPLFSRKQPKDKKGDAPDANKYTLGGRSPFLTSVSVEKRPLSSFVPEETAPLKKAASTPVKNAYRAKVKQIFKEEEKPARRETTIVSTPEVKSHSLGLTIAIILTIILGASIGALVYLIFFQ